MRIPPDCPRTVANLLKQLTHTADGMFAVDPQGRIIAWNPAAEALLGYSAEEVQGKYCYQIIQGCDRNGCLQCSENCPHFEQGKRLRWVRHLDLQTRCKSGQDIWINVTTLYVLSGRRKLAALVHLFRNVDGAKPLPASKPGLELSSLLPLGEDALASPMPLSGRELAVLRLLAEGQDTKEIASHLFISPTTVRNHAQNILRRLEVHSRIEAVLAAIHHHWV